jgi:hypothetical protein
MQTMGINDEIGLTLRKKRHGLHIYASKGDLLEQV